MMFSATSRRTMNITQPMVLVSKPNMFMMNSVASNKYPKPLSQAVTQPETQAVTQPETTQPPITTKSRVVTVTKPKQMKWGEPVWFFLHTLAHKVKDDNFAMLRADILKHIYTICTNLPCPDCSMHAKNYLGGINFNNIRTKMDLKNMLFEFHNSVNARKGFAEFSKHELDKKYDSANFNAIINYFISAFLDKHASPRMISDDIYRTRLTQIIKKWLIDNLSKFNP